ncbi:hypothetical protein AKJ16_DCAP10752 [Drosera capensis]
MASCLFFYSKFDVNHLFSSILEAGVLSPIYPYRPNTPHLLLSTWGLEVLFDYVVNCAKLSDNWAPTYSAKFVSAFGDFGSYFPHHVRQDPSMEIESPSHHTLRTTTSAGKWLLTSDMGLKPIGLGRNHFDSKPVLVHSALLIRHLALGDKYNQTVGGLGE